MAAKERATEAKDNFLLKSGGERVVNTNFKEKVILSTDKILNRPKLKEFQTFKTQFLKDPSNIKKVSIDDKINRKILKNEFIKQRMEKS